MKKSMSTILSSFLLFMCFTLFPFTVFAEEIDWTDVADEPVLHLLAPLPRQGYGKGSTLQVTVSAQHVTHIEVTLDWQEDSLFMTQQGDTFDYLFTLPKLTTGLTVKVKGYGDTDHNGYPQVVEVERKVPSPKEALINQMFDLAYENSKDKRYKFAPAQEDHHIGLCKNYVMRLFDTFAPDYGMLAYEDLPLYMPKNNSLVNCAPYDYGIEWRYDVAQDGSPFEIAAQFKYNNDLTKEENEALAREMMEQIQAGDFFQMVGFYGGGNGPHSLLFMSDYDPLTDNLYWTDSNMRGTRIDGVRWGYLQYYVDNTAKWFIDAINTPKRGATVYRLRDDLFRR